MGRQVWSTRDLPAREQFAFWRELVCRHAKAITYDRDVPSVTPFTGELVLRPLGTARLLELYAEGRRRVSRRSADLARAREPACHIYQQRSGTFRYRFGGRELVARPGDVMVAAPDAVFEGEALGDSSLRVWALPPSRLLARLAARALPLLHIPAADGTGAWWGRWRTRWRGRRTTSTWRRPRRAWTASARWSGSRPAPRRPPSRAVARRSAPPGWSGRSATSSDTWPSRT